MNTTEMLDAETEHGLFGDTATVYRGPCTNRLPLREAYAQGVLCFSVNRSHIFTPPGAPTVKGYHERFEDAVKSFQDTKGREWRISAHCKGWGFTEECIVLSSSWNPLQIEH